MYYYVPCRLVNVFGEFFYKVKNITDMFNILYLVYDGKSIEIEARGFPKSYIDACIDSRFNVSVLEKA